VLLEREELVLHEQQETVLCSDLVDRCLPHRRIME
jgi:hypothetical protein